VHVCKTRSAYALFFRNQGNNNLRSARSLAAVKQIGQNDQKATEMVCQTISEDLMCLYHRPVRLLVWLIFTSAALDHRKLLSSRLGGCSRSLYCISPIHVCMQVTLMFRTILAVTTACAEIAATRYTKLSRRHSNDERGLTNRPCSFRNE
jgi:hypothetical protein